MSTSMFERMTKLLNQAEMEKRAAEDPNYTGGSEHESAKIDDPSIMEPETGEVAAENEQYVAEETPGGGAGSRPDATTEDNNNDQEKQQMGTAKATGEDPSVEDDYQEKPESDKGSGDGQTEFAANTELYGETKTSLDFSKLSDDRLFKTAAAIGNKLVNMLTDNNASYSQDWEKVMTDPRFDKVAADVIGSVQSRAERTAELVAGYLYSQAETLQKAAEDGELPDNYNPEAVAPDDEKLNEEALNDEALNEEDIDVEALAKSLSEELADRDVPTGEPGDEEGALTDEELEAIIEAIQEEVGEDTEGAPDEFPEEVAGEVPPEVNLSGQLPVEGVGDIPPELEAMSEDEAMQELSNAMAESGIADETELAEKTACAEGYKLASMVANYKAAGKFRITGAPKKSAARVVRDYMKNYISELCKRSRK